jgi:hypothetical protein
MKATDITGRPPPGQLVIIAGVLCELCRWGNFRHSVTETTEAGNAFCIATYGKSIPQFARPTEDTITDE